MSNTKVIILAAGKAHRFGGTRKQMLKIGKDTIIGRTLKQCHLSGHVSPAIMVRDLPSGREYNEAYDASVFVASDASTTCNTILSSQPLWDDRTIILLGDVIYSPETIRSIFEFDGDIQVWGDSWEIFAVSFTRAVWYDLIVALEKGSKFGLGKIRYMYKYYISIEPDKKEINGKPLGEFFTYVHDWTRDIDMQQEYYDAILQLVNTHILDKGYV